MQNKPFFGGKKSLDFFFPKPQFFLKLLPVCFYCALLVSAFMVCFPFLFGFG